MLDYHRRRSGYLGGVRSLVFLCLASALWAWSRFSCKGKKRSQIAEEGVDSVVSARKVDYRVSILSTVRMAGTKWSKSESVVTNRESESYAVAAIQRSFFPILTPMAFEYASIEA